MNIREMVKQAQQMQERLKKQMENELALADQWEGKARKAVAASRDDLARQALYGLLENIAELREDHNESLRVGGIIVNQFQSRARLPRQLVEALRSEGLPILEPMLPSSVVVRESHEAGQPLAWFAPRHRVTEAFDALYQTLHRA